MDEIKTADGIKVFCAHRSIEKLASLKPTPDNPNKHPKSQIKLLAKVIQNNGWRNPIVVSTRSGMIVKGHGRFEAAKFAGMTEAPVDFQAYESAEQERQDMLADNRLAELAEMDQDALKEIIQELEKSKSDLELAGFDKEAVQRILGTSTEELEKTLRVPRVKLQWGRFKVFHCVFTNQVFCTDNFRWLISYGTERNKTSGKARLPDRLKTKSTTLFVDSGMLTLAKEVGPRAVNMQDEVIEYAHEAGADWVTMMDIPLIDEILTGLGFTKADAYKIMYSNAEKFAAKKMNIRKVYVCQGQQLADYRACAKELSNYVTSEDVVAIGSIKDRHDDPTIVSAITSVVREQFPNNDIHLFGITNPRTVCAAVKYGATSCDSATAGMRLGLGDLVITRKEGGEYCLSYNPIAKLMNEPNMSTGGPLWTQILAFSAGQIEAVIGLNMAMEEANLLFNAGYVDRPLEQAIEQPQG